MDNFTPLKTKKKKRVSKFLIIGNIFLVMALIFMTNFLLKDKLISTQQKAAAPLPTCTGQACLTPTTTQTPTRTPTPIPSNTPTPILILSSTPTVTLQPTGEINLSPTLTPTEIVIAKISTSPTVVVSLPKTGTIKSFIYIVPALIMLIGLIL